MTFYSVGGSLPVVRPLKEDSGQGSYNTHFLIWFHRLSLSLPPLQVVVQADPDLVALHCQEIGGKDFETSMGGVRDFVKYIFNSSTITLASQPDYSTHTHTHN